MDPAETGPGAPAWTVGVAAALAVIVLAFYRGVLPLDVLAELALPWLWILLWTVAAWGAGRPVARTIAGRGDSGPGTVVTLALGSACLALVGALLAWVGALRPPVLLLVLALAAAAGALLLHRDRDTVFRELGAIPLPVLVTVGVAAMAVAATLPAPPVMYDTLNYHLAFPYRWLEAGRFVEFSRHTYSFYPAAGGMLYTYALASLGPWAAKGLHLWAGLLATAAAGSLGHRLGGPRGGGWAAVLFFLTPSVLQSSGFATADLWVAAWGGSALLVLLMVFDEERRPTGFLAASGFLAGSAAAAKILGLATVMLPVGLTAAFLVLVRRRRGSGLRQLAVWTTGAIVPLAPWFVRNVVWTGNPLYPYFRQVFGGPPTGFTIAGEVAQNGLGAHGFAGRALEAILALGVRTFHPLQVAGGIGPLWLILLPVALLLPALWRRRSFVPLLVAVGSGLVAWGSLVQFGRFLLPVLVAGAALAGAALAELSRGEGVPMARRALVALVAGVLAWNATVLLDPLGVQRLEVTAGVLRPGELLERWVSYWPAARFIDDNLPAGATVLMVAEARTLYVNRKVVVEDPYRVPLLAELAAGAADGRELAARLEAMGITHLLVNEREMPRMAALRHVPDYWTGAGAHGRAVLREFLKRRVRRVFEAPGVWVAELSAPPPARNP